MGNEKVDVRLVLSTDRERSSRPLSYVPVGGAPRSLLPARHFNLIKNFKLWNPTWNPATRNSNNKNLKCQELIFSFCDTLRNRIVQWTYDLATACTIRFSNPDWGSRFLSSAKQEFQTNSETCKTSCWPAYPGSVPSSGVKRQRHEDDHSPSTNVEVKNQWSYTTTPPTRFHSVYKNKFIFKEEIILKIFHQDLLIG
jgi:hypothetical protein